MTDNAQPRPVVSRATSSGSEPGPLPTTTATTDSPSRPRSKHSRTTSNISKRRSPRSSPTDFLSDRATSQLIRRVLCPQQVGDRGRSNTPPPIDELLPPLTSRNDVDLQLYAIIAIIIRDFVQTWYHRITPDEDFVAEVVQIIAHCTRALEQRLRKVDIESLLFDELPDLLDKHVQAYRASRAPIVQPPLEANAREIYHSLCPLPYLSPIPSAHRPGSVAEQAENEAAYRQLLVQGVLAVLLPTEDLENDCLTSIVGQIFSELIIGGVVAKKLAEPWMIWTGLTILADVIGRKRPVRSQPGSSRRSSNIAHSTPVGFSLAAVFWALVHYVFVLTALVRSLFTTITTYRTLPPRGQVMTNTKNEHSDSHPASHRHLEEDGWQPADTSAQFVSSSIQPAPDSGKTPILAFGIWSTLSNLVGMDRRMPWLLGSLSMMQWLAVAGPGQLAGFDGVIDRLLSNAIHRSILDPAILPTALRNLRGALFPNNAQGTPSLFPPSSDRELFALRRRCASALWAHLVVPRAVGRLYFGGSAASWLAAWWRGDTANSSDSSDMGANQSASGSASASKDTTDYYSSPRSGPRDITNNNNNGGGGTGASASATSAEDKDKVPRPRHDDQHKQRDEDIDDDDLDARIITEIETDILDVFSDAYCNKHLMYGALELILVRLLPELAEKGVMELWEERLS